jgi:hypothetical protein
VYKPGKLIDAAVALDPDGSLLMAGSSRTATEARPWVVRSKLELVTQIRRRIRGNSNLYLKMLAGVAIGKVTLPALRKGLIIGRAMANPELFLEAHKKPEQDTGLVA